MLSNLEYEQDWASKEKTYTLKDKFVGHVSDDGTGYLKHIFQI